MEAGTENINAMVRSYCSKYPRDNSGACSRGDGEGDRCGGIGGIGIVE